MEKMMPELIQIFFHPVSLNRNILYKYIQYHKQKTNRYNPLTLFKIQFCMLFVKICVCVCVFRSVQFSHTCKFMWSLQELRHKRISSQGLLTIPFYRHSYCHAPTPSLPNIWKPLFAICSLSFCHFKICM